MNSIMSEPGMTAIELAKKLGRNRSSVGEFLKRYGIHPLPPSNKHYRGAVLELLRRGMRAKNGAARSKEGNRGSKEGNRDKSQIAETGEMTVAAMAKKLGRHEASIFKYIRTKGVKPSSRTKQQTYYPAETLEILRMTLRAKNGTGKKYAIEKSNRLKKKLLSSGSVSPPTV